MQERINKIIEFLIKEISQLSEPFGLSIEKLSEKLLKEGYTEREIHKAVEWVIMNLNHENVSYASQIVKQSPPAVRFLIAEELNFFSPEAHGYLIQLQMLGIISALQVEQIIERCFLLGMGKAGIDDVKTVVSQMLLGKEVGTFDTDAVYYPGNDMLN